MVARHHERRAPALRSDKRGAPALFANGGTLHWSATATSGQYIESRTAGPSTTYVVVAGTSDTPPTVAGATVAYQVRPRYQPHQWSNVVEVAYPRDKRRREGGEPRRERTEREARERAEREAKELAEREAKERAEREAKEKAEREAKELAEREAKEKAEREAKERAEREAKEKAEREAKERAEREAKEKAEREARERVEREERERRERGETGGAVVGKAPTGPPAPASGWHVVYADGFGDPLGSGSGEDNTLQSYEKWNGCCTNSNEIAVEQHSQAHVGQNGLELVCSEGSFTVEGVTRKYSCGSVRGDAFVEWNYANSGEWVAECVCRWPANTGASDPGFWVYSGAQELDFFEGWGWNGTSWLNTNAGMPVVVGQHEIELGQVIAMLGFDPSAAFHRYTTAFVPVSGSTFHVVEYLDGIERSSFLANLANTTDGPILTNALRQPKGGGYASADVMTVRSIAIYQDGAHAGQGVRGGGIAPGTTVN